MASTYVITIFSGGGKHVETPCENFEDWSMDPSSADNIVNCKFIEEDVKDSASFCNRIKMHRGLAGQTASDAWYVYSGTFFSQYIIEIMLTFSFTFSQLYLRWRIQTYIC